MTALIILFLGIFPTLLFFIGGMTKSLHNDLPPLRVIGWALLLGYSLKSFYLAYAVSVGADFRTDYLSRGSIPLGQIAITVGLAAMLLGFVLTGPRSVLMQRPPRVSSIRLSIGPIYWMFFAVSVALMIVYFINMGFADQLLSGQLRASKRFVDEDGISSTLGFLTIGADFLMIIFLYHLLFDKNFSMISLYGAAIAFVSVCHLMASRRNGLMIIIAAYLMVAGIRQIQSRVGMRAAQWVLIGIGVLGLAVAGSIRQGGGEKAIGELSVVNAINVSVEHVFEGAYFLDPAKTAAIVQQTDAKNLFLNGSSFTGFIVAPIPRIWWPDKPDVRIGPFVAQEILLLRNRSGVPPGGIGEFYLNFGWIGIIIGMAIVGMLLRWVTIRYETAHDRRFARIPYVMRLLCIILFLFGDFTLVLLSAVKFEAAMALCAYYWSRQEGQYRPHVRPPMLATAN
jgi:oligosaccharide repeat unit polymerase